MIIETSVLAWYLGVGILLLILGFIPFLYVCFKTWSMPEEFHKIDVAWFIIATILVSLGILLILIGAKII